MNDKQRLDFLEKSGGDIVQAPDGGWILIQGDPIGSAPHPRGKTIRELADNAAKLKGDYCRYSL